MEELHEQISKSLDIVIASEVHIGNDLRDMLQSFVEEKRSVGFSFGALCIVHYESLAEEFSEDIFHIAAAIELLALSFDIIDDLQDNDTSYIWTKTPSLSLNVVISMIFMASKTIQESKFEHKHLAVQLLVKYALSSINGQQLDLLNCCQDEQSYLQMVEQKSGSLTAIGCLIGAVLAQGSVSPYIEQYSKCMGVIHQIKNDIDSLKRWEEKNDLLNKKYTLPIIYLLNSENDVSKSITNYYNDNIIEYLDKNAIKEELVNGGAIRYALAIKNLYKHKALDNLQKVTMKDKYIEYLKNLMK